MGLKKYLIHSWAGGASALKIFRASPSAAVFFVLDRQTGRETDDTDNLPNPFTHPFDHVAILLLLNGTCTQISTPPSILLPPLSYQSLEDYRKMYLKCRAYFTNFPLSAGNAASLHNGGNKHNETRLLATLGSFPSALRNRPETTTQLTITTCKHQCPKL